MALDRVRRGAPPTGVTEDDAEETAAQASEAGEQHAHPGSGDARQPLDRDAAALLAQEAGRGQPLPPEVAASAGVQVPAGEVRVHTSETAQRLAAGLGATAFTVGPDIYFADGGYQPGTAAGRGVLRHELAHVVQQSGGPPRVQRLLRTPFPWHGVITAGVGANLRSAPDLSDPANIVRGLVKGTVVRVIGSTGLWLHVEVGSGPVTTGYVHHALVDDAGAHELEAMVGTKLTWKPSGPTSGTDFQTWASAAKETKFPSLASTTVINCWEVVLLAAYQSGALSWSWIHTLYTSVPYPAGWMPKMAAGPRRPYLVGKANAPPQRGDLVFFDTIDHVALATGKGSEVYTVWPPPDTPFDTVKGKTEDRVKVFTIEDLATWWTGNYKKAPKIEIGAPSW